jgi:hypothetical protein
MQGESVPYRRQRQPENKHAPDPVTKLHTEKQRTSLTRTSIMRRAMLRGPAPSSPVRNTGYVVQKSVGSFVPKITKQAFEKFGFPAASLLTDWSRIVGVDVARYTSPERLKWSRTNGEAGEGDDAVAGRPAATLVIRVDPARALDVEYKTRILIDRINAYFGYRAVGSIRVVQGLIDPSVPDVVGAEKAPITKDFCGTTVAPTQLDPLAAALERLGSHVRRRNPR